MQRVICGLWLLAVAAMPLAVTGAASAESGAHRTPPPPPETTPITWPDAA